MIDDDKLRLPDICGGCGAELMLTPSGHPFCADPTCTDGFGVAKTIAKPISQLYQLLDDALKGTPIRPEKNDTTDGMHWLQQCANVALMTTP
jgi:hypothetical protein